MPSQETKPLLSSQKASSNQTKKFSFHRSADATSPLFSPALNYMKVFLCYCSTTAKTLTMLQREKEAGGEGEIEERSKMNQCMFSM